MKRKSRAFALLAVVAFLAINLFVIAYVAASSCKSKLGDYSIIQSAQKAILSKDSRGVYTLRLYNVTDHATVFSENPKKRILQVPIEKIVNFWEKRGGTIPKGRPNSEISGFSESLNTRISLDFSANLSEPEYDEKSGILTYTISGNTGFPEKLEPMLMSHVVIFAKDTCLGCWWP